MNKFTEAYETSRENARAREEVRIANEHAMLVESVKKEFGVNDFASLIPSQRNAYKSMIREMWSSNTGLTKKGLAFVNEGKVILTKASTDADIEDYFRKAVNVKKCIASLVKGESCDAVSKVKADIERMTGKKFSDAKVKSIVFKMCGECIKESLLAVDFDSVDKI